MNEDSSVIKKTETLIDDFVDLWRRRPKVCVLVVAIVVLPTLIAAIGIPHLRASLAKVTAERDKAQLRLAPFLATANRHFENLPEDKRLDSLSKKLDGMLATVQHGDRSILTKLESIGNAVDAMNEPMKQPINQPIASATATVILNIKSDANLNARYMDSGGYAAFGQGNTAVLQASSHESWANQIGNSTVRYRGVFTMPATSPAAGKPLDYLLRSRYIQTEFLQMPTNSLITGGQVIFVVNDSIRLEFAVPEQTSKERQVFIRDLTKGMKPLASNQ